MTQTAKQKFRILIKQQVSSSPEKADLTIQEKEAIDSLLLDAFEEALTNHPDYLSYDRFKIPLKVNKAIKSDIDEMFSADLSKRASAETYLTATQKEWIYLVKTESKVKDVRKIASSLTELIENLASQLS